LNDESKIKIGTCAWSFEDWRGTFYPEQLATSRWLEFYAQYFHAVEIDSTFYHIPRPEAVARWFEQTPDNFVFTCKVPREITHELKLRRSEPLLAEFLEAMEPLHPKLECVLVQLPPSFRLADDEPALKEFVHSLPRNFQFAIEFRHADWHLPRIAHLLENCGVAWVWNDITSVENQARGAFEFLPQTANFLYLRLLGDLQNKYGTDGNRIHRYGEILWPRDASLDSWAVKVRTHLPQTEKVYILINNHFEGSSPRTCRRIAQNLGIEFSLPDAPSLATEPAHEAQQLDLL
jgi:uncharacterized protein YecE (DUF72 family)